MISWFMIITYRTINYNDDPKYSHCYLYYNDDPKYSHCLSLLITDCDTRQASQCSFLRGCTENVHRLSHIQRWSHYHWRTTRTRNDSHKWSENCGRGHKVLESGIWRDTGKFNHCHNYRNWCFQTSRINKSEGITRIE